MIKSKYRQLKSFDIKFKSNTFLSLEVKIKTNNVV